MNRIELYAVIAYNRFNNENISVFECMLIHQHINQNKPLNEKLEAKINRIHKLILDQSWTIPEYRYNQDRVIEVYDDEKFYWKRFKPIENEKH